MASQAPAQHNIGLLSQGDTYLDLLIVVPLVPLLPVPLDAHLPLLHGISAHLEVIVVGRTRSIPILSRRAPVPGLEIGEKHFYI
jgi:hypothetical protein